MSLTSYRAAPPRARVIRDRAEGMRLCVSVLPVLGGSGGDRLSRVLRHSTMGAGVFNGRVRDGIGFWAHRSGHQTGQAQFFWDLGRAGFCDGGRSLLFGKQGERQP